MVLICVSDECTEDSLGMLALGVQLGGTQTTSMGHIL